jgi:anti-sigma regulatory factor (Ser/Thr protein kinase)
MSSGRRFPPKAASAAEARGYVRSLLVGYGRDLTDAVVLLTSELVSNAIVHGESAITIDIGRIDGHVRVSVSDESEKLPELHFPDPFDPNGRGLAIVNELSDAWGVERGANGKTVWFTLAVDSAVG